MKVKIYHNVELRRKFKFLENEDIFKKQHFSK